MTLKKVAVVVCIFGLAGFVFANMWVVQDATAEGSPYQSKIEPLTTAECAQCHLSIFQTIKTNGGKHQIDCVRCHKEYHVYNPRKQNYDAIMPKCSACHQSASGGPFHGEGELLTPCLNCHADPHQPLVIPMPPEAACPQCHPKQANEIKNFPSKHTTDVTCTDCHADKHGYIPDCSACHENHSPQVQMTSADCMTCHPVHKPTQITYAKDTPSAICAGCHEDVYDTLQRSATKHTNVACADCHPAHKEIPACSRCHGEPHPADMMVDVTNCGQCHGTAHDLVK